MIGTLHVVTDLSDISALNDQLTMNLSRIYTVLEPRVVGYPSNHHSFDVGFSPASLLPLSAWAKQNNAKGKLFNLFLTGIQGSTDPMEIELQINFPADAFTRNLSGVFVKDQDGISYLAHRGRLTKGKGGLKQSDVLDRLSKFVVPVVDGKSNSRVILIGALEDPMLAYRISEFAHQARTVATELRRASPLG